eukprot:73387_1
MSNQNNDERDRVNEKGWVEVEAYKPENLKIFTPNKTIKIRPNDKAMLQIRKVTFEDGNVIIDNVSDPDEENEQLTRVWCCDDEPEIKGLSEGIKGRTLGEFLRIKCSPNWGYPPDQLQMMGIPEDQSLIFWVWIKEVDPYLAHDPKCCTIL